MRVRTSRPFLLAALLGTAFAVPAFAQQPPSTVAYPVCAKDQKASAQDSDFAHALYLAGKGFFDEADYDKALAQFKEAYRRDCTKHELLIIIARSYELKADRAEAIRALELYIERVPNASDLDTQKRRIAKLKEQLAAQPPPTASAVATAPAATGSSTAPPPPSPKTNAREHTIYPWLVVGTGGLAAATGAILFAVGSGNVPSDCDTATKMCKDPTHKARAASAVGLSNAGIGIAIGGGVLAIGGVVWHFLEPTGSKETQGRPRLSPSVGPGFAGLDLGGRF